MLSALLENVVNGIVLERKRLLTRNNSMQLHIGQTWPSRAELKVVLGLMEI